MTPAACRDSPTTPEPTPGASRRMVFHGLGALGVAAALAGCGGDGETNAADTSPSPSPSSPPPPPEEEPDDEPTSQATEPESDPPADEPAPLATTAEVPVRGGLVLFAERIVLTQPEQGRFEAFSAVCKHEGEIVSTVENGTITCTVHGSQYDAATGEVTGGPAQTALDPVRIEVVKDQIRLL